MHQSILTEIYKKTPSQAAAEHVFFLTFQILGETTTMPLFKLGTFTGIRIMHSLFSDDNEMKL